MAVPLKSKKVPIHERMEHYRTQRQHKLNQLIHQKLEKEKQGLKNRPSILKKSLEIVKNRRNGSSENGLCT